MQGQLAIWNISRCYFMTYTDIDYNVEIIEQDSYYWNQHKVIFVNFFKDHVLPEILKDISNELLL